METALRARREGEGERADRLLDQARQIDPEGAETLSLELGFRALSPDARDPADADAADREVAAMGRTIEPGPASPSRAGITRSGSGADGQGG